jgi:hypothetical protein
MSFFSPPPPGRPTPPVSDTSGTTSAVHCVMFAVDIVGFARRDAGIHLYLRETLYKLVEDACAAVGLAFDTCRHEDRGDAVLVIAPAAITVEALLGPFAANLHAGLRRHNRVASPDARLRLRMAVEAGFVQFDGHGAAGLAVIHLFRLLDASSFKALLQAEPADLGLITSNYLYEEVVRFGPGTIDPFSFQQITVVNKETHGPAWVWLPPPPVRDGTDRPATGSHQHGLDPAPADIQIAILVALGWTIQDTARALDLSPEVVRARIGSVLAVLSLATGGHHRDHRPAVGNQTVPRPPGFDAGPCLT